MNCSVLLSASFTLAILMVNVSTFAQTPIVIAHRGASAYLPEHTLAAKAMAHAFAADYLEQDVVLTRDAHPIVLHDICLETISNVKQVFPNRHRSDGRYYAIDFSLQEIKQLNAQERISEKTGRVVFPNRFPAAKSHFSIPTLAEEIELVQGLNQSTKRIAGIYTEIKSPAWHREQGKDISRIVLDVLNRYGFVDANSMVFVQCFDPEETRRMRMELGCRMKLIQLIEANSWDEGRGELNATMYPGGLKGIAQYAEGIGPEISDIVRFADDGAQITSLTTRAHQLRLVVHPYTLRADLLPKGAKSFEHLFDLLAGQARVDGMFTDHPDQAFRAREQMASR